jgi:divalent metal cation (Fe/Co/Zn/Cd) transporter
VSACVGARPGLQAAVSVEWFTVGWMTIEAIVSIGAGLLARSPLLTAFGLDSVIELITSSVLLWRLRVEAQGAATEGVQAAERRAQQLTAIALVLLCMYVLATAVADLLGVARSEGSTIGILISLAAVVVMPWLAWIKRRLAQQLGSEALRNDAASSLTCGYMAAAVLVGVALNTLFNWWWAEGVAALVFLVWLLQETREAIEEARESRARWLG